MRRRDAGVLASAVGVLGAAGCATLVGDFTLGAGSSSSSASASASSSGSSGFGGAGGASSTTETATTSSNASSEASSSGAPLHCVPSMLQGSETIDPGCGVFVDGNAGEGGDGSKTKPFNSLGTALGQIPPPAAVYMANNSLSESVTLNSTVTVYGGVNSAWSYVGTPSAVSGPPGTVPVTINAPGETVSLFDLDITAQTAPVGDGGTGNLNGLSTIAVIDNQTNLNLTRVSITAGNATGGRDAPAFVGQAMTGGSGYVGAPGEGCDAGTWFLAGGAGGTNVACPGDTTGGQGGVGLNFGPASPGSQGAGADAGLASSGDGGSPGAGETSGEGACAPGGTGDSGDNGTPGSPSASIGTIGTAGYTPPSAASGSAGIDGQGGGGGGGSNECDPASGGSGGGGGAGGCGGAGGAAGGAGGSSIGLIVLATRGMAPPNISFMSVVISAGNGGKGGNGAPGQKGGAGGFPGSQGGQDACPGGSGGAGGDGGSGPGGNGGHALAIATLNYTNPIALTGNPILSAGNAGDGGVGSPGGQAGDAKAANGNPGFLCEVLDFTTPTSTTGCTIAE